MRTVSPACDSGAKQTTLCPATIPGIGHIDQLDSLRAIAILAVYAYHSMAFAFGNVPLPWDGVFHHFDDRLSYLVALPLTWGWCGVPIFFAISGYCINMSWIRSRNRSWPQYFARRWFRIYPPYLIALVIVALFLSTESLRYPADRWNFLTHALLVHNLNSEHFYSFNQSFWSIAVEWQLYLLFPALLFLTGRLGWKSSLLALLALEAGAWLTMGIVETSLVTYTPYAIIGIPLLYWFSWSIGASVAQCQDEGRPSPLTRIPWQLPAATALIFVYFRPTDRVAFTLIAVATAAWIARQVGSTATAKSTVSAKLIQMIGVCSYSIYLLHQPFLWLVKKIHIAVFYDHPEFRQPIHLLASLMAASAAIIPICYLYYKWVELPSIACGKWFAKRYLK